MESWYRAVEEPVYPGNSLVNKKKFRYDLLQLEIWHHSLGVK